MKKIVHLFGSFGWYIWKAEDNMEQIKNECICMEKRMNFVAAENLQQEANGHLYEATASTNTPSK